MKMFALIALSLVSFQSFAKSTLPSNLVCDNGHLEDDRLFQVTINKNTVQLNFWESSLSTKRANAVADGNTVAVVEKTLTGFAEGEDISSKVSALFVYNPQTKKLNTTVVMDGVAQIPSQDLTCR